MTMTLDCKQETNDIADELLDVIRPYYKGLRRDGGRPDFRKCLKSSEVEDILGSVHDIIVKLKVNHVT